MPIKALEKKEKKKGGGGGGLFFGGVVGFYILPSRWGLF